MKLKDVLQERSLIDRWGFLGFAVIGGALIWFFKQSTSLPSEAIAVGAAALMILYAWVVSARGTGKLRSDQAGDNCYYLGLIFTLVSLAHAIFTFDPANMATTIVQGFGIALLTTILGLVLRVFFNQARVDLYETEDNARLELAEAAGRLKTELSQIANNFSTFAFGLQQALQELRDTAHRGVGAAADESVAAIRGLAATAGEGLQSQTSVLKERVSELSRATTRTTSALERHAATLEHLAQQQESAAESLKVIENAVSAAAVGGEQMRGHLEAAATAQSTISTAATNFSAAVSEMQGAVGESVADLQRTHSEYQARMDQLEKVPREMMDSALRAIAGAAERLQSSMDSLAAENEGTGRSIASISADVLASVQAHNRELEAELAKSRANAGKVHEAFVEVTNALADRVEQIAR